MYMCMRAHTIVRTLDSKCVHIQYARFDGSDLRLPRSVSDARFLARRFAAHLLVELVLLFESGYL